MVNKGAIRFTLTDIYALLNSGVKLYRLQIYYLTDYMITFVNVMLTKITGHIKLKVCWTDMVFHMFGTTHPVLIYVNFIYFLKLG
jgi:hypothetical protein